jgi:hypothetical protein
MMKKKIMKNKIMKKKIKKNKMMMIMQAINNKNNFKILLKVIIKKTNNK